MKTMSFKIIRNWLQADCKLIGNWLQTDFELVYYIGSRLYATKKTVSNAVSRKK